MANTTDPSARNVHGTDPQYLIEKITRLKIRENLYWKEHCFALTAELLVDKAVQVEYVGGCYGGNRQPTQFMCLILKMLQIQPEKDIIVEFLINEDYKYVRILGAFYLRLIGKHVEIYKYLEMLLNDYRKIRVKNHEGKFEIKYVDEIIDDLLTQNYYFDIALPFLPPRRTLELAKELDPRASALDDINILAAGDNSDSDSANESEDDKNKNKEEENPDKTRSRSREKEKGKDKDKRRSRSRSDSADKKERSKRRDRSREKDRRRKSRSRSRERRRRSRS